MQEQKKKRKTLEAKLSGRILAFACVPSPCHSQFESLHASIYYGSSAGWQRLWGWSGFRAPENVDAEPIAKANAKPKATAKAKAKALATPVARTNVETPQEQWQLLSVKKGMGGAWIQLPKYLTHLKLPKNKAKRDYLEGLNAWKIGWRKLQNPAEWQTRPGSHGGVPPTWIRADILESVFLRYHVKS